MSGNYLSGNITQQSQNSTKEMPSLPDVNSKPPHPFPFFDLSGDVLIDETVFNTIEIIINVYLINALSVIGSIGNILSIIILYVNGFKSSSTNVLLVSLAVTDLLLVFTMPLRKVSLIIQYFDDALAETVENHIIRYQFLTLNRVWSLISNTHVAIISVERVLAVYYPFQVGRWVTAPRMTVVVLLTHAVWYVALIPLFTMFDLKWIRDPRFNETIAIHTITDFYKEREGMFNDYYSYFINITVGAFLLVFTLACCIAIMIKILKISEKRERLTGPNIRSRLPRTSGTKSKDQDKGMEVAVITAHTGVGSQNFIEPRRSQIDTKALKMLMAVCITFLVLTFPTFFLPFFQGIFSELREPYWRRVNFVATSFSMLLITINSSANFVIYIMMSSKFHKTFVSLCTCNRKE